MSKDNIEPAIFIADFAGKCIREKELSEPYFDDYGGDYSEWNFSCAKEAYKSQQENGLRIYPYPVYKEQDGKKLREGKDFNFCITEGEGASIIAIPIEPETKIKNMKSGIELITEERQEQIEKHGFSIVQDARYYKNYQLIEAALFCIDQAIPSEAGLRTYNLWPKSWAVKFKHKIEAKDAIGKLKVAGALIAAEIDRLQNQKP